MMDDMQRHVDELAAVLAGLTPDETANRIIGLCVRLDEGMSNDAFDQVLLRVVLVLRQRQELNRWPGLGKLWDAHKPEQEAAGGD
jgi:hypothetical protein